MKQGLILSGGGAKGFAHVGVYHVFFEHHVPIHAVAGCSIGALIAAGIAQEKTPEELLKVLTVFAEKGSSLFRLHNIDFKRGGVLAGKEEMDVLTAIIPKDLRFENLKIPLAVNAVDLEKGEELVFTDGSVLDAVRASMAIPGLYPPVFYRDKLFVDGGVLNSIPTNLGEVLGMEKMIAVDLKSYYTQQNISGLIYHFYLQKEKEGKLHEALLNLEFPFHVLLRALSISEEAHRNAILKKHPPDVLIHPDVSEFSLIDTKDHELIYKRGIEAGKKWLTRVL